MFFNPSLKSAIYMVPGVAAILLMLITALVTAMGLSREREAGTLEQVLVTPMPGWVLIAGKILPFAAFGLFDFILAIVVGAYVFHMPIVGSVPLLLGATAAYLLVTLGMGLLVATFSSGRASAQDLFVPLSVLVLMGVSVFALASRCLRWRRGASQTRCGRNNEQSH